VVGTFGQAKATSDIALGAKSDTLRKSSKSDTPEASKRQPCPLKEGYCLQCQATESPGWYRDPIGKGKRCKRCYHHDNDQARAERKRSLVGSATASPSPAKENEAIVRTGLKFRLSPVTSSAAKEQAHLNKIHLSSFRTALCHLCLMSGLASLKKTPSYMPAIPIYTNTEILIDHRGQTLANTPRKGNSWLLEYQPPPLDDSLEERMAYAAHNSRLPCLASKGRAITWHARMGHLYLEAVSYLPASTRGVKLLNKEFDPNCKECRLAHLKQIISQRPKAHALAPFKRVY
jgi:hypothetical protein